MTSQRVKQAAVTLERAASSIDEASRALKVEAAQSGNPKLNQLSAKVGALRQQLSDLAREINRA